MITYQPPPDPPITLLFDLLARYAQRQGWIPIGYRRFDVGPWSVTVNGTPEVVGDVPPYHALIEHKDIVALILCSPFGGWVVGGWSGAEEDFIHALEAALAADGRPPP